MSIKTSGFLICFLCMCFSVTFPNSGYSEQFTHEAHKEDLGTDCSSCHVKGALSIVPENKLCLSCHDQELIDEVTYAPLTTHTAFWYTEHKTDAGKERNNCSSCHDQQSCLDCHKAGFANDGKKANIHRSDFKVTHPVLAKRDNTSCVSCHEKKFCSSCHKRFAPHDLMVESHRKGWSSLQAGLGAQHDNFTESQCSICHPDSSVLPSKVWTDRHAREARRNLQSCQVCHPEGEVCLKCHSAKTGLGVNPHPGNWSSMSRKYEKASNNRTCNKCH